MSERKPAPIQAPGKEPIVKRRAPGRTEHTIIRKPAQRRPGLRPVRPVRPG